MTWVSLPVGRLRNQRLSIPLSSITLTTYLPSGEMAARAALPEFVTCVMVNFWKRRRRVGRCNKEHGLNAAVNRLRACLGDEAEKPRYIETLPRRGCRLIAPVNGVRTLAVERNEPVEPAGAQPAHTNSPAAVQQHKWVIAPAVFAVVILLGAAGFGVYSLLHRPTPTPFPEVHHHASHEFGQSSARCHLARRQVRSERDGRQRNGEPLVAQPAHGQRHPSHSAVRFAL